MRKFRGRRDPSSANKWKRLRTEQKALRKRIADLQKQLAAEMSNEKILATAHLNDRVTHVQYKDGQWEAFVNAGSTTEPNLISLIVNDEWVKENFHQKFVEFMEIEGRVDGFTPVENHTNGEIELEGREKIYNSG